MMLDYNFVQREAPKKHRLFIKIKKYDGMSDNSNEKQSVMDKEEVQKIIDERIARIVEKEKQIDYSPDDDKPSLRKLKPCNRIRQWIINLLLRKK